MFGRIIRFASRKDDDGLVAAPLEIPGMARRSTRDLMHGQLTASIIGSMQAVHGELGFGYRELIYSRALERLLVAKGHSVAREVSVMVFFRGEPLATQILDMVVDGKVAVEIKSGERLHPAATAQLFGYLSATILEVGLVLHFGRTATAHRVFYENRLKAHQQNDGISTGENVL